MACLAKVIASLLFVASTTMGSPVRPLSYRLRRRIKAKASIPEKAMSDATRNV